MIITAPTRACRNGPPRSLSRVSWAIGSLTLAKYVCKTMINIARNFDALNVKGRDTSRVMAQLLAWYQELKTEFQATQEIDPALAGLLEEAQA